jgi:hypothetical protein
VSEKFDAHIHLFENGYGGSFTNRPGVAIQEAECFESLMADYGVSGALVVGYAAQPWCATNNDYLRKAVQERSWIHPVAFRETTEPLSIGILDELLGDGFAGLSFYIFDPEHIRGLHEIPDDCWKWFVDHHALISVNSKGEVWQAWKPVLDHHPDLHVIVSHLGLPPQVAAPPQDPARNLREVLELAAYPGPRVKLSGFYAMSDPGHDYPHTAAWPYVQALKEAYGANRLLWASDFSPCLDWLTYPQTMDLFEKMPFFNDSDRDLIMGKNLGKLLADSC